MTKIKAIDFFCGGGGMSYGMKLAGVKIIAGIDIEKKCKETYEANINGAEFICEDIFDLKEETLEDKLRIKKNDDSLIIIGCSPCQYWSIINTHKKKSEKSKNLLIEFQRFIKYFNPGYVVVENVPGVLKKKDESGLTKFIDMLHNMGYKVHFKIHNVKDFFVPQNRKRFTLIANRVSKIELIPKKARKKRVVKNVIGVNNGFPKIRAGTKDKTNFRHSAAGLSELNLTRLSLIEKDGGNRLGFANIPELQLDCFINRNNSFKDTFGRLWWDKPSPTITTKFFSISNGRFVHPEENRALSLREGAVLQSFPKSYLFLTQSIADTAKIIGNAVPPEYAKRIGLSIIENHKYYASRK